MISETGTHLTLIDELDARQNEVLDQLDELNGRVEQLLRQFTARPVTRADPNAPTSQLPSAGAGPAARPPRSR